MPRSKAAWPTCCRSSETTLTSLTPRVTGRVETPVHYPVEVIAERLMTYAAVLSNTASW